MCAGLKLLVEIWRRGDLQMDGNGVVDQPY